MLAVRVSPTARAGRGRMVPSRRGCQLKSIIPDDAKASTAAAAAPLPPRLNHFHCTYLIIVDCCGDLSHFRFGAAVPQDPAVARRGRTHDGSHLAPFLSGHGGCCLALFNGSASSHGWRSPRTAVRTNIQRTRGRGGATSL